MFNPHSEHEAMHPYKPISFSETEFEGDDDDLDVKPEDDVPPFSWLEYLSFFTIGLSMMWTWSMILQAIPYFQRRFKQNSLLLKYFQACNLIVFAATILVVSLFVNRLQSDSSHTYPLRLSASLLAYISIATMLTLSTLEPFAVTPELYFAFLMTMVHFAAAANGLSQNAAFAFVAGFPRTEYAPGLMAGESLAGLLPSIIEISSALAFPSTYFESDGTDHPQSSWLTSSYFLSGAILGAASIIALQFLRGRSRKRNALHVDHKISRPDFTTLAAKLRWPALANFLCLCISSVSPVFASKILSIQPENTAPTLLRPQAFIPLAIVLWNIGDLLGSGLAMLSRFLLRRPFLIFMLSFARLGFIPLYLMCNINGRGSIAGDWFYLIVVQFLFGLTHGWLSGTSMMGALVWVDQEEREAAGAFMGFTLVSGLVTGSVLGLVAAHF